MKAAVVLAFIMSVLSAPAQTITTVSTNPISGATLIPCANQGQGEYVEFSGKVRSMFHTNVANGLEGRFFLDAGEFKGKGSTTGKRYKVVGSSEQTFAGFNRTTGDGTFDIATNYHLVEQGNGGHKANLLYHQEQQFIISDNGNTLTIKINETVCK